MDGQVGRRAAQVEQLAVVLGHGCTKPAGQGSSWALLTPGQLLSSMRLAQRLLTGVNDVAMGGHLQGRRAAHEAGQRTVGGEHRLLPTRPTALPASTPGCSAFLSPHPACAAGTSPTRAPRRPALPSCVPACRAAAKRRVAGGVGGGVQAALLRLLGVLGGRYARSSVLRRAAGRASLSTDVGSVWGAIGARPRCWAAITMINGRAEPGGASCWAAGRRHFP